MGFAQQVRSPAPDFLDQSVVQTLPSPLFWKGEIARQRSALDLDLAFLAKYSLIQKPESALRAPFLYGIQFESQAIKYREGWL